ncbi:MAG: glycosyltransferase family 39 protein [Flavobacteriales bacterium]|nr:glycosyltransferase family 39 protein [Flavobacteriales bacterium]
MEKRIRNITFISIIILSTVMHFNHFSKDLMSVHVWRQTQTQVTISTFYEEDMNIFNPRRHDRGDTDGIFRMEFPIMQWLVACLYKVFGNHLIITRLFMFLVGLLAVLGMYQLLDELFHAPILSAIGAWAFNFSPSFYYYTINPMPDNFALCCSIWGLALFFRWYNGQKNKYLIFSNLLICLGALSKLPFILFYIVPLVYFIQQTIKNGLKKEYFIQAVLAGGMAIFPIAWYAVVIPQWKGNAVLGGMLKNDDSPYKIMDYLQHNLISTMPELLVGYGSMLFFLAGFFFLVKNKSYKNAKFSLLLWLSVGVLMYYLFEANAIAKIHDYYLFPFYPLLFILVAYGAFHLYNSGKTIYRNLALACVVAIPIVCFFRMHDRWNPEAPGFNKDLLVYKTELQQAIPNDALVVVGNDESYFISFYYIDKKGWGFHDDNLTAKNLKWMISKGAEYLYTDSKNILKKPAIAKMVGELVFERGSIQVYKLKKSEET